MRFKSFDLQKAKTAQQKFVTVRAWEKFHTPKNLSMALVGESAELVEIFQWLTPNQAKKVMEDPKIALEIRDEIGDILFYLIRIADTLNVDPGDCFWQKLKKSAKKYPVELAKGKATKYTKLGQQIKLEKEEEQR